MAGHASHLNEECLPNLQSLQFENLEEGPQRKPVEFTLSIKIADLEGFINDPELQAQAVGTLTLNETSPIPIGQGLFNLFVRPELSENIDTEKEMHYQLYFHNTQGEPMTFFGYKTLTKENGLRAWQETTTLYFYIWKGHSSYRKDQKKFIEQAGILHISPLDFIKQLTTFRTDSHQSGEMFEALTLFFGEFAKNLWEAYAPFVFTTTTSRWREHLIPLHTTSGVRKGSKEVIPFNTDDGISLSLNRFKVKPSKNIVILMHGLTTSTDMFIMPEHYNLVNYLHDHGYDDVWSLDWRGSERHTYNLMPHRFTIDDVALYDVPKALDVIRSQVGTDAKIHIICHCVGSIAAMTSIAAGLTKGVQSVISNSVSLTPKVQWQSRLKITFGPDLLEHVFGYPYLSPRMPYFPGPAFGKWIYWMERMLRRECKEPSCHMVSFMWGWGFPAAYQHENLHPVTHRRLHDLFGGTSFHYYRHIRKMIKNNVAIPYSRTEQFASLPESYLENIEKIDLPPIMLLGGDQNHIFPGSNKLTFDQIRKIKPGANVEYREFKNYGHQDTLMGKNVHLDVFPHLLAFLKKHS